MSERAPLDRASLANALAAEAARLRQLEAERDVAKARVDALRAQLTTLDEAAGTKLVPQADAARGASPQTAFWHRGVSMMFSMAMSAPPALSEAKAFWTSWRFPSSFQS